MDLDIFECVIFGQDVSNVKYYSVDVLLFGAPDSVPGKWHLCVMLTYPCRNIVDLPI